MENLKQKLSDVYITLGTIDIKGSQAKTYALCLQALEESVMYIDSLVKQEANKE